ncbi:hypothetical protein LCGC14_0605480 [marine sediment metagenome]|uniref:Uncharacterized protein n=2 Tax=root TaxID=1 RepID=A0A9C9NKT2_9HYPH|nr:hypothetical protein [Aurantimonas coralicida]
MAPGTETVICYMRNGHPLDYGRLPGCPRVPATPEEIEVHPVALKSLRQDPRIVFCTAAELKERKAELEANAADRKERQAAADAERAKATADAAADDLEKPDKKKRKPKLSRRDE